MVRKHTLQCIMGKGWSVKTGKCLIKLVLNNENDKSED